MPASKLAGQAPSREIWAEKRALRARHSIHKRSFIRLEQRVRVFFPGL
jgi:hypothetical protein